ncbi:hypothetical protein EV126DRAFT_421217 [Verticillium dahliae]|nr:hypothetical protein EV126DRAFT_421217 [Verticillium dahliae]
MVILAMCSITTTRRWTAIAAMVVLGLPSLPVLMSALFLSEIQAYFRSYRGLQVCYYYNRVCRPLGGLRCVTKVIIDGFTYCSWNILQTFDPPQW